MPESSALPLQVVEALGRGWVVVTANQRAARTLRRAFEIQQRESGLTTWAPPTILAWDSWLESVFRQLVTHGRASDLLLNPAQEHTLWKAIVAEDATAASLRPHDALAEAAARAWALLHAYDTRPRLRQYQGNSDTRVFASWAAAFERRLKRGQYLTHAQLFGRLKDAVLSRNVEAIGGLLLVGFDTISPSQAALIEAWRNVGVPAELLEQQGPGRAVLAQAASNDDELLSCATWLRRYLEKNPKARLGVIVPSIETTRADIDRLFRLVLSPELNDIGSQDEAPYEFSLGVPLGQTSMVATAMSILRWSQSSMSLERVSSLLLSPHFAVTETDERVSRAEFDAFVLRRKTLLQPQLTVDKLYRVASQWGGKAGIAGLLNHVRQLRSAAGAPELPLLRSYGEWAQTIADLLSAAGWAPAARLGSTEFQIRRKWEGAVDELASLDFDDQRVPFAQALSSLEYIVQHSLFAPESHHAPVQIMGPLESAGSTFDAVWFLRANEVDWSTLSSVNPLLPWAMQRDLQMPGAVPAHDADVARAVTMRIAASAPQTVFSYARESTEGPQRASPALIGLFAEHVEAADLATPAPELPLVELEALATEPPIPPPSQIVLQGGAGVLEKQAACAFRVFAEIRLFSTAPETASLGLDGSERGSIVHRVLQSFWQAVGTQAALRSMSNDRRNATLDGCITEALHDVSRELEPGWSTEYVAAERQRLHNLLRPWLEYEAHQRSPFAVKSLEHEYEDVSIGPLHLKVKVDRVDTWLKNGTPAGEILLDYKTGRVNTSDWEGERPDAPQLPLYAAVASSPDLVGVAFASVRPGNGREIRGIASEKNVLPKMPRDGLRDLAHQVEEWRETLTVLAEEFHSGTANVRPKKYPDTCRYCQQRLLCRLDVSTLTADETEDEDVLFEEDNG